MPILILDNMFRVDQLRSYGVNLTIPFPDADSEDHELLIIPPHMTHPTITTTTASTAEHVEVEKAKYIAYYLAGQFEVIMELLVDMSRMFSVPEEDDNEEDDDDDEEDEEDQ